MKKVFKSKLLAIHFKEHREKNCVTLLPLMICVDITAAHRKIIYNLKIGQ